MTSAFKVERRNKISKHKLSRNQKILKNNKTKKLFFNNINKIDICCSQTIRKEIK